jgi:uncharacterized protein
MNKVILDCVNTTPLIDTHEHLIEESERLGPPSGGLFPCDDWAYLFLHYCSHDLTVSGMPKTDSDRFFAPDVSTTEKYKLVAPYWAVAKHTGYGQAVRKTLQGLYGEDDLTETSVHSIAEKYKDFTKPGFYKTVFEKANIPHCHVNALGPIFRKTAQPDLLKQDIGFPSLMQANQEAVKAEFGLAPTTLDEWTEAIDQIFATCGPHAIAAKNQCAYWRLLDFENVKREDVEIAAPEKYKAKEDFLFRYCVQKATEHQLPVKLHTGYYAGTGNMPLARVKENAADLVPLIKSFPDTTFVLMHIGYPYQDEYIALAKHYKNVVIDMCWAWIINPVACVRFLREFLLAVPANKILPFGGDYFSVENIYGHAAIARQGIALTLSSLVEDGWLREEEALLLIPQLMHKNAEQIFPKR